MSAQSATDPTQGGTITDPAQSVAEKGKGKATEDVSMGEDDDDSSDEETGAEEDVGISLPIRPSIFQLTWLRSLSVCQHCYFLSTQINVADLPLF